MIPQPTLKPKFYGEKVLHIIYLERMCVECMPGLFGCCKLKPEGVEHWTKFPPYGPFSNASVSDKPKFHWYWTRDAKSKRPTNNFCRKPTNRNSFKKSQFDFIIFFPFRLSFLLKKISHCRNNYNDIFSPLYPLQKSNLYGSVQYHSKLLLPNYQLLTTTKPTNPVLLKPNYMQNYNKPQGRRLDPTIENVHQSGVQQKLLSTKTTTRRQP